MQLINLSQGGVATIFLPIQHKSKSASMDLLDSILGSMDKPPSLSERDKEKAKGMSVQRVISQ